MLQARPRQSDFRIQLGSGRGWAPTAIHIRRVAVLIVGHPARWEQTQLGEVRGHHTGPARTSEAHRRQPSLLRRLRAQATRRSVAQGTVRFLAPGGRLRPTL